MFVNEVHRLIVMLPNNSNKYFYNLKKTYFSDFSGTLNYTYIYYARTYYAFFSIDIAG